MSSKIATGIERMPVAESRSVSVKRELPREKSGKRGIVGWTRIWGGGNYVQMREIQEGGHEEKVY